MNEKEISLGRLFIQEAVRAGTWGLVFLIIMGMFITSVKQDIKEGIAFGVDRFVSRVYVYATHPASAAKVKKIVKKGIDYSISRAAAEAGRLMGDTPGALKKDKPEKESPKPVPGSTT